MRLGRHKAHAPAPQRCGDFLALHPVEKDVAIGWIKVGDGAQQPSLAAPGGSLDGQALTWCHFERERRQARDR